MQAFIFMTSLLAFYLKGKIEVTQQAVKIREPNTILKFIPLGATNETIAIGHIASCDSSFSLNFKVFLAGLICCFIGFGVITIGTVAAVIIGLIIFLLGVGNIINSFETVIQICKTSSDVRYIKALIFDKKTILAACDAINKAVLDRTDDTNTRLSSEKLAEANSANTDRIVDALKK